MMKNKAMYTEIAKARVSGSRNVVISACSKGGYTVAQQLVVDEGNRKTTVFLKGAIHVEDADGMYELRDALNVVLGGTEKSEWLDTLAERTADVAEAATDAVTEETADKYF